MVFLKRHSPARPFAVGKIDDGKPTSIIDVYDGAKVISRKEAEELVFTLGVRLRDEHFQPATKKDMIVHALQLDWY